MSSARYWPEKSYKTGGTGVSLGVGVDGKGKRAYDFAFVDCSGLFEESVHFDCICRCGVTDVGL